MKEAFPSVSTSLIAARIVSEIHLLESDYDTAIQVVESGLRTLANFEQDNGKILSKYVCFVDLLKHI